MHTSCLRGSSKCPQWFFCPNSLLVPGSQGRSLFAGPLRLELATADAASLTMAKVPEGGCGTEGSRIEYGMRGRGDESWGRRAAFQREPTFIFAPQFLGADLRLSGRGMVSLSSAMQTNLPKAAMIEEVQKHTEAKGSRH